MISLRSIQAGTVAVALTVSLTGTTNAATPVPDGWAQSAGDAGHNRFDPGESTLTPATVGQLRQAWTVDQTSSLGTPVIADGVGYLAMNRSNSNLPQQLRAVDLATGRTEWQLGISTLTVDAGLAVVNGILYAFGDDDPAGGVTAINLRTHQVLWTARTSKSVASWLSYDQIEDFAIDGGRVFMSANSGNLDAFDAASGRLLWTQLAGGSPNSTLEPILPPLVAGDGKVVYRDGLGVAVHDAATGKLLWRVDQNDASGKPTIANGRLYLASYDRVSSYPLAGCGADQCAPTWSATVAVPGIDQSDYVSQVSGIDANTLLFSADSLGRGVLDALDATTGAVRWTGTPATYGLAVPVTRAGDVVYALQDDELLAYDIGCAGTCTPKVLAQVPGADDLPNAKLAVGQGTVLLQRVSAQQAIAFRLPGTVVPPAGTSAYIAGSRAGSAVYLNGLIKQAGDTHRSPGRSVYLQRFLGGSWQNLLSRTSDADGQLAVGFIQKAVLPYRLVVIATSTATGAVSSSSSH